MSNASPSVDPANTGSLLGLFNTAMLKLKQDMDGAIPGIVQAFDRGTNRVQVLPAIKMIGTNNEQVPRAPIANVPVFVLGAGGFGISFNLRAGDTGLLIACDRDISIFTQSGGESSPQSTRMKSFSDSYFLPDVMKNFTVLGEDLDNLVIQKNDGSVRISLSDDTVKIVAPNIELSGLTEITGNLAVIGNITATGNITPNVPPV